MLPHSRAPYWTVLGRRFSMHTALPPLHLTRHFKTFMSFIMFMELPVCVNLHNILTFLEYLFQNHISPKVIRNYLSSVHLMAHQYNIPQSDSNHYAITNYIRSISINSAFRPTPRGIFDLPTLYQISISCDILNDPILFRAIFLTSFYEFLCMSNIAPHSASQYSPSRLFLRQDLIFAHPGAHLIIKWTKPLQDHNSHHAIQLPSIQKHFLCPVRALKQLLQSRPLPPHSPLFANNFPPFTQVIDTHIPDSLKKVLAHKNIPLKGHSFHTFRRSGATLAFDNNISLQNIQAHGLWHSSAVWTYLQNASVAPSIIPSTFQALVSSSF